MSEPSKEELLNMQPEQRFDTESLRFEGLRGDVRRHLGRAALEAAVAALPAAPRGEGSVELLVARGPHGERELPREVRLTVEGGMPQDRWGADGSPRAEFQLATAQADFARLIANGQPLELHGDNLYLQLELSSGNLPPGSLLRVGAALLRVTAQPHNGCKKWVQRFGLAAMQLNLAPRYRERHLRGIYLQVVEDGRVRVGDRASVVERAAAG
jgi:hypothetical protein